MLSLSKSVRTDGPSLSGNRAEHTASQPGWNPQPSFAHWWESNLQPFGAREYLSNQPSHWPGLHDHLTWSPSPTSPFSVFLLFFILSSQHYRSTWFEVFYFLILLFTVCPLGYNLHDGKTVLFIAVSWPFIFYNFFLLLFKYSCLHFLPTTPPRHPSHPHFPPWILPLFGFVHVSFIDVPEKPSSFPSPIIPSHIPSG